MQRRVVMLLLLLALPGVASGARVQVDLLGTTEYDDAVRQADTSTKGDVRFRVGPRFTVTSESGGRFNYDVTYRVFLEEFASTQVDTNFDHYLDANVEYRLGPATKLFGGVSLAVVHADTLVADEVAASAEAELSLDGLRRISNAAQVGILHTFSPRLQGTLTLSHALRRFEQKNLFPSQSLGASADLSYVLSTRDSVGLGGRLGWTMVDAAEGSRAADSQTASLFGRWRHAFSPTLDLSASAGPLWIFSEDTAPTTFLVRSFVDGATGDAFPVGQVAVNFAGATVTGFELVNPATCPASEGQLVIPTPFGRSNVFEGQNCSAITGLPRFAADDPNIAALPFTLPQVKNKPRLTFTTSVALTKSWERSSFSMSLNRADGQSVGDGATTVDTSVVAQYGWDFAERWRLDLAADYSLREQESTINRPLGAALFPRLTSGDDVDRDGLMIPGFVAFVAQYSQPGVGLSTEEKSGSDRTTITLRGRLTRRFTRNLVGFLRVTYRDQSVDNNVRATQFERFRVGLGFRYTFADFRI